MNFNMKKYQYPIILAAITLVLTGLISSGVMGKWLPDRELAWVQKFKPDVSIENNQKLLKAERGEPLYNGDTLTTDNEGYALVQFMDKSFARVKPQSMLIVRGEVRGPDDMSSRIGLEAGEVFLEVTQRSVNNFEVATSTSVASVKGTQFGATAEDFFYVVEGEVELLSNRTGETVTLTDKTFGQVNDDGSINTGELTDEKADSLQQGYDELDSQLETKTIRFQFRDENGQIREIELEYYINN